MVARTDASPIAGALLLAVDGSEDSALAARAAADLSGRTGSELHVVHAWHTVPSTRFGSFIRAEMHREAEELLAEEAQLLERAGAAQTYLKEGPAVDTILDLAEELGAGLLVLGSRGLGPVKRLALGSVSEGVVHHAARPVLVMRGGSGSWPPERVLVGDDGSEAASEAGRLAANLGALFDAKAMLLRSFPRLPRTDVEGRRSDAREVDDELRRQERELWGRARDIEAVLGTRPKARIAVGDPAARLLEAAEEEPGAGRTLVAVGSRGLGPVGRARLGSASTKVLRAAEGPVLVYPVPSRPRETGRG